MVSGSDCTVVFRHSSGDSAEDWQKTFGSYEKQELTTSGSMRPSLFVLFSGRSSSSIRIYTPKQEFRVKISEIQNLEEDRAFASGAGSIEIRHCFLADECAGIRLGPARRGGLCGGQNKTWRRLSWQTSSLRCIVPSLGSTTG